MRDSAGTVLGMSEDVEAPEYYELDRLVRGVGQVCISASMLESRLAFLTMTLDFWTDEKYREVLSQTGRAVREYRDLVPRLEAFGLGPDVPKLLEDAERLLRARNRVVHSVLMIELKTDNEQFYEAWNARADETWEVNPTDLQQLAEDLAQLVIEANAFACAWEQRAERDGWPLLPR
jgi:hypothetical protein